MQPACGRGHDSLHHILEVGLDHEHSKGLTNVTVTNDLTRSAVLQKLNLLQLFFGLP